MKKAEIKEIRFVISYHPKCERPFSISVDVIARSGSKKWHLCMINYQDNGIAFNRLFGHSEGLLYQKLYKRELKDKSIVKFEGAFPTPDDRVEEALVVARAEYKKIYQKAYSN